MIEAELSDRAKPYPKEYKDAKRRGTISKGVREGVVKEVPTAEEIEERRAIQEKHLAEEVGDFLDGLIEPQPRQKGLLWLAPSQTQRVLRVPSESHRVALRRVLRS